MKSDIFITVDKDGIRFLKGLNKSFLKMKILWTSAPICGTVVYCKGGADMAQMSLEELYRGEGVGEKYGIMGEVMKDFFENGRPSEYDERTWLEMLLVKHALIAAEKMKNEGDTVSGMTDDMSSSSYVRWNENDNA